MTEYVAVFFGGLLGSAHCVGMCGSLVAMTGIPNSAPASAVLRQLTYCTGRVFTYSFLGAVAGFAGDRLSDATSKLLDIQRILSIGAGSVMILIGVAALGWFRMRFSLPAGLERTFVSSFRGFLSAPGRTAVFLAGVCNGFLPCGLVYTFLAFALASGSSLQGGLLMAVFGLGTVPAMTVIGCGSSLIGHYWRSRIYRIAAFLIIFTGGVTIYRAVPGRANCCSPTSDIPAQSSRMGARSADAAIGRPGAAGLGFGVDVVPRRA